MVPLENSAPLALSFLFQRLKWPVPMSRWRTAKEICKLLNHLDTRSSTTAALLDYLDKCRTESEVCEILVIVFLTSAAARPNHTALTSRIHCPSILADMILERTYGPGRGIGGWRHSHSGQVPADFEGGDYFEEHKTAHVPPMFLHKLRYMEDVSGYPFVQHWAYEWKALRNKLGTRYTRYPHYFDDVSDARSGIVGQYWQRMREIYLSAYLRTLGYAVSELGMPKDFAEEYSVEVVHGIAGFFDLEPGTRPAWISDLPERCCSPGVNLTLVIRELVKTARADGMRLVSLKTPIDSSVQKFAMLTVSAHLVTPDYEPPDGAILYEPSPYLSVADTFELKGPPAEITIEEARNNGKTGDQVPVCNGLLPIPFGTWQGDYLSIGPSVPSPYVVPTKIRCTHESIDCIASDGKAVSRTRIWNDNWTQTYPRGGSTRCGTATMMDEQLLAEATVRLGRKLAFFIKLSIWDREKDYGDYSETKRSLFFLE